MKELRYTPGIKLGPFIMPQLTPGQLHTFVSALEDSPETIAYHRDKFLAKLMGHLLGRNPGPTDYMKLQVLSVPEHELIVFDGKACGKLETTIIVPSKDLKLQFLYTPFPDPTEVNQ